MATSVKTEPQLELWLRVGGQRAFVIAETGSYLRSRRLAQHLRAAGWEPRAIAVGPVAVYAVKEAVRQSGDGAPTLEALEAELKRRYRMAVCEPGFSGSLYRVAQELARSVEAEFAPVERCVVCGEPDPFPTILSMVGPTGAIVSAPYCARCVAASEANTYGRLCRSLLDAGQSVFADLQNARLGRARRKGTLLLFPIRPEQLASAS